MTLLKKPLFGLCHYTDIKLPEVKGILTDLNIKAIRTWISIDWNNPPNHDDFNNIREYKKAGFKVIAACAKEPFEKLDAAKTTKWFKSAFASAGKGTLDGWEIGNEYNSPNYYRGNPKSWVQNLMRPAYEVLSAEKQVVYGTACSENTNALDIIIENGYLNYCDVACHHPYETNPEKHIANVKRAKALVGNKDLALTEWNIHGYWNNPKLNDQKWAASLQTMFNGVSKYVTEIYYYRFTKRKSPAGPAGVVLDQNGYPKNDPYYTAVKNLH